MILFVYVCIPLCGQELVRQMWFKSTKFILHQWERATRQMNSQHIFALEHSPHARKWIFQHVCKTFRKSLSFFSVHNKNSSGSEMTTFLRVQCLATNSPHYSWHHSRGHCHGVYFFTSLNWKSKENELRRKHMEWTIGLTLTCPQTVQ